MTAVLLIPPKRKPDYREHIVHTGTVDNTIEIAFLLARKHSRVAPTVESLMADFGMSRGTAYRWVRAWNKVNDPALGDGE